MSILSTLRFGILFFYLTTTGEEYQNAWGIILTWHLFWNSVFIFRSGVYGIFLFLNVFCNHWIVSLFMYIYTKRTNIVRVLKSTLAGTRREEERYRPWEGEQGVSTSCHFLLFCCDLASSFHLLFVYTVSAACVTVFTVSQNCFTLIEVEIFEHPLRVSPAQGGGKKRLKNSSCPVNELACLEVDIWSNCFSVQLKNLLRDSSHHRYPYLNTHSYLYLQNRVISRWCRRWRHTRLTTSL